VVDIVHQCLRKDPAERFASAQDLRNALLAYKASFDTSATTTVTPESETPNNLPLELTSFVGRETELDRLARLLEENRLVTITGTGGGGKTRLGLELAGRHLQDYRDGVYLIELAAVTEGDQLAETMARTMNVRQETGTSIEASLVRSLGSKSMLLIIDNCEHILENVAPLITKLLKSCPNLKVLATSRERLDVPGETAWPIPSLRVPAPEDVLSVATAASNEAVRLFAERASSASTGFSLTDSNLEDVVQICHRLDGIPLAIELAAARVRLLDLKEILKRLEDRFRLLRGGSRTSLPRQQTLKATVAWSVDLLTEEERILFSRLSIFSGGFTLGSAEAILSDDVVDEFDILDHLSRLADKSLVSVTDSGARYHLLEMLREYGAEELQTRGETETFLKRHAEYFLALAEEAEPELTGAHQGAWLERLAREYPNIDQAGATLVSLGMAGESLRLGAALWRFLFVRGYLEEGRQLLESILAVETSGLEKAAQLARAKALRGLGTLANDQGDYPIARERFLQCLDIYRSLDHHAGIAQVSNSLGIAARDQGEYEDARRLLADAMKAHQEAGNKAGESASIHGLGIVAHRVGDLEEARERFDAGLKIRRQLEDRRGIAALLAHLGSVELDLGNLEQAEALLNQGLDMFRELGNKRGILWALMQLGGVALAQGNIGESRRHHRESLFLSRSLGDKHHVARSLECFASLNLAEGKP
ncbi:MAG: tetratricopeptide repeat protein, partial [Candidatus Eisenbacteria bacterium]|nr:tetratricopeptide repeat protein [Candidatus Eisenbacteria bacterium]